MSETLQRKDFSYYAVFVSCSVFSRNLRTTVAILLALFTSTLSAQTVDTYNTPGSFSWTCPPTVTSIKVEAWGSGGGGGGANNSSNNYGSGGGGGGYTIISSLTVVPGTTYTITVAVGGAGANNAPGLNGGLSRFGVDATIANGGTGGAANSGLAGVGGIGTYSGGAGSIGLATRSGGGGGGAGTLTNGSSSLSGMGGAGGNAGGGAGADGRTASNDGVDGAAPGGGGGGGYRSNGGVRQGGNGGNGRVVLTYTIPAFCGTFNIGPTRSITTLTSALSLLNTLGVSCPVIFQLDAGTYSSAETFPIQLQAFPGASATNTLTIRPAAGAVINLTANVNSDMVRLTNAANYYVIDGINNGGASLNISNSNTGTSAATLTFSNGARNNLVRNSTILGSGTTNTGGTIFFTTSSVAGGNSNNTVSNCNVGPSGVNTPRVAIASVGTTTAGNRNINNTISNNNIYDFFAAVSDCNGLLMADGTSDWTVTGNSFYLTSTRTITTANADWNAIQLRNTASGNNILIQNNFIGGNVANAASGTLTINGNGAFKGIALRGGPGTKNIVSNNVIRNINFSTSVTDICSLIYHSDGSADISNNTVGSQTTLSSIVFQSSFARALISGANRSGTLAVIFAGGAIGESVVTSGVVNITGNTLGGIQNLRLSSGDVEFRGIDFENSNCFFNVNNNTVGGTIANSISNNSDNSTLGIIGFAGTLGYTHQIENNTIQNITTMAGSTNSSITALQSQGSPAGVYSVANNTIRNLTANAFNPGFYSLVGISAGAHSANQIITGNNISNLAQVNAGVVTAGGIIFSGPTAGSNVISRNMITAITTPNSTGSAANGIDLIPAGGTNNIFNNMVIIGYDNAGASLTSNTNIIGIRDRASGGIQNLVYNSVHIGGTGVTAGAAVTFAIRTTSSTGLIRTIANNMMVNTRTASATDNNLAYGVTSGTGLTSYSNNFYSPGLNIGSFNGSSTTNLPNWQTASGQDANSVSTPASFLNEKTDLRLIPSPSQANFISANEGTPIAGFTVDYYGNTRDNYTPDLGFHEYSCRGCWVGKNSTVWEISGTSGSGGNWEDGFVPNNGFHSKVSNALYQPTINTSTSVGFTNDFYLKIPAYVTVTGGTLEVYRNFNLRGGVIDGLNGTLEMKGASAQIVPANLLVSNGLLNLTISNSDAASGVSLQGNLDIFRALTFTGTGQRFNTNDFLIMKSTASETSWIGNLTGKTFTGQATIERYLSARKAWRFLAVPVASVSPTIQSAWQEGGSILSTGFGTRITGPSTIAGVDEFTVRSSVKFFNSTINNFTDISSTSNALYNKAGYMVFVRGDRSTSINGLTRATTLRAKGNILSGNQTVNVPANGFQSFGNPYASALSFTAVTKTNVANGFIIWNPNAAGAYGVGAYETYSWDGTNYRRIPGGTIRDNIQSGEAVFVQGNTTTAGLITIKESDKFQGSASVSRGDLESNKRAEAFPMLNVNLFVPNDGGALALADGFLMRYNKTFASTIDNDDYVKIFNTSNNLNVIEGARNLVMNSRPEPVANDTIHMRLSGIGSNKFQIQITSQQMNYPQLEAFVDDQYLQTSTPVSLDDTTTIDYSTSADVASRSANRFKIIFKPASVPPLIVTNITAVRNRNRKSTINWKVVNHFNVVKYEVERSADGVKFVSIASPKGPFINQKESVFDFEDELPLATENYYRLKYIVSSGRTVFSSVAFVPAEVAVSGITVYPNPVVNKKMQIQFNDQPKGKYSLILSNAIGQTVYSGTVNVAGIGYVHEVDLSAVASKGTFQLQVISENGKATTQQILIN